MGIAIGQDGKRKLCVGKLPGRARPSLYLWDALGITTLASFRDESAAKQAEAFLEGMIGARIIWDEQEPTP
jgi:hypothetical protein